jgi:endonuclease/exonuclease/phosphatase (EEP) superfamily protein YafD
LFLSIIIFGLAAATALSMVRNGAWPIELLTHFRPQAIAASLVLGVIALLLGEYILTAMAIGLAMLNWAVMPDFRWLRPDGHLATQPGLTLAWANVWTKRVALDRTLKWAQAQSADVILIGEFPDADANDKDLAPDYPHRLDAMPGVATPKWSSRVVAFSKLPISAPRIVPAPSSFPRPFLAFTVELSGDSTLDVYAVHPSAPLRARFQRDRDAMIDTLAKTVAAPFVIAGDFNATPWSRIFSRVPGVRVGRPFHPTWLTPIPFLGLPIDHIMVSSDVKPSFYAAGPFLGSDHRPIIARVHPPLPLK